MTQGRGSGGGLRASLRVGRELGEVEQFGEKGAGLRNQWPHRFPAPGDSKNSPYWISAVALSPGTRASLALRDGPLLMRNRDWDASMPLQETSVRKNLL